MDYYIGNHILEFTTTLFELPSTTDEWLRIAEEFENKWLFPHALGVIAGRHIGVRCPKDNDVAYVNYALFSSIILMAVVDANSNFLYVEVGRKGNTSNEDPFQHSKLCHMLDNNKLNVPESAVLQVPYTLKVPYMLLADEGFSFNSHRLRPFPQTPHGEECALEHGFNIRHALARMPADNAMGIMIRRFCVLRGTMELYPADAAKVVAACAYLHNFLLTRESRATYAPPEAFDRVIDETIVAGKWREDEQIKSVLSLQDIPENVPDTMKQLRLHMAYHFQHNDSQAVPGLRPSWCQV
uniref:DDE Tnp4 domain-containing protein n=1 Tax=Anopheles dirus TaxID=7168 RepID=A0A182NT78_9DIPT